MKKILFIFLALAGLTACSSDDNTSESEKQKLIVQSIDSEVEVGQRIDFMVSTSKQKKIEGVILLCDNKQIESSYVFDKVGKYSILARKKGYLDSNVFEITVKEKQELILVLSGDKKTIGLEDKVTFSIKDNKGKEVKQAKIYNTTTKEVLQDGIFLAKDLGDFTFIAKADNYKDSDEFTVSVHSVFSINERQFPLDIFMVSIEVENIFDAKGNSKKVD